MEFNWELSVQDKPVFLEKCTIKWIHKSTENRLCTTTVAQLLSHAWLFATPWTAARQPSLLFTICWSLLKFMSIESVMPSNHLVPVIPFSSCLQSFPASGSFPMSHFFASDGHSIEASASVLVMNIQDGFCLGLTGLISSQSKELSRVFSRIFVLTFFTHVNFTFNKT